MAAATAPSERYLRHRDQLRELAGPGFGGRKPEQDPDPDGESWIKKLLHQLYCLITTFITKNKNDSDRKKKNR